MIGSVVRFLPEVDVLETGFEANMLAKVQGVKPLPDGVFEVVLNFTEFEDHNKKLMTPNFYDGVGTPRLKWCETQRYPKDGVCSLLLVEGVGAQPPFAPVFAPVSVVGLRPNRTIMQLANAVRALLHCPPDPPRS
jgi:hypothetical protein